MPHENWPQHIHPQDIEKVHESSSEFLKSKGNYWSCEYRFIGKNKQVHYFAERAFLTQDRKGNPSKLIASVTDITYWQLNINHLEEILFTISHKVRLPVANI